MCFIKNIFKEEKPYFYGINKSYGNKCLESKQFIDETWTNVVQKSHNTSTYVAANAFLSQFNLFRLNYMKNSLIENQQSIECLLKKTLNCQQKLDQLMNELQNSQLWENESEKQTQEIHTTVFIPQEQKNMKQQVSENFLTRKLFGEKKYKYRLTLEGDFPSIIYKERNIKINLTLRTFEGKIVKNSNIINLCFALADDNGNWITVNRVGDAMLKGKTEVQLYHGEAEFNKIYTKDISKTFTNGKINIVVYAKPSILIYNSLTSDYEVHADDNSVQPLIISDISIKAKKKY